MNYIRTFYGQESLPTIKIHEVGELKCLYTGKTFSKPVVDAYNKYSHDFNKTKDRATQEFLLNQRFSYIMLVMNEQWPEAFVTSNTIETEVVENV